jgi:selenocysteine lyase/cysteine desulfurase
MPSPLPPQAHLFSLPEGLTYLNSAFMGPLPTASVEAGIAALRRRANPHTMSARDFFEPAERVRRLFAQLVHADPERVAFVSSASAGLAVAARNLRPSANENVVLLGDQFPSNVYPWRGWQSRGVQIRTVAAPEQPAPDTLALKRRALGWNARLIDAIDRDTAMVSVEQAHWTDGTLFDLERLGQRCRAVGAALVVDATQTVGAMPLDVQAIQPDLLVVHSYKSMLAHYGLGFMVLSDRFANGIPNDERWLLRQGSEDFSRLVDYRDDYAAGMRRFDSSLRANPVLIDTLEASLQQLLAWKPFRVREHLLGISRRPVARLRENGFGVLDEALRAANLFGVVLPDGWSPERCRSQLTEHAIHVAVRGASVRVSPHMHNVESDLERLTEALLKMG